MNDSYPLVARRKPTNRIRKIPAATHATNAAKKGHMT